MPTVSSGCRVSMSMRNAFLSNGSRSSGAMEPEVSMSSTRLARGRSDFATSYPLMAMWTSLLVGFQGEGSTETVGRKGALRSSGSG